LGVVLDNKIQHVFVINLLEHLFGQKLSLISSLM